MVSAPPSPFDFRAAVARQFADRPTLRAVASQQLLALLRKQLPYIAGVQPELSSADALMLDSPEPGVSWWTTQPLVDAVLEAMAQGQPMNLEPLEQRDYKLGLSGPYRFPGSHSEWETRALKGLSEPLNELIEQLPGHFAKAQVDFWAAQGDAAVSRDRCLAMLLRLALLRNLPLQGLDARQKACMQGLLLGETTPSVFVVNVQLCLGKQQFSLVRSNLLVVGEWDEREVVLWCSASSVVQAFASLDEFALALRDELAADYQFDDLAWDRHLLEGDVFAQQAALLLDGMLERIGQVRYSQVQGLAALEHLFATLSDPAQYFHNGYFVDQQVQPALPPGLATAGGVDSFAWQQALLVLALNQLESGGHAALDGVLDLRSYTREQLRAYLEKAFPDEETIPSSDDVLLKLSAAAGMPGGAAVGTGGGEPLVPIGDKSLTEFAIDNLASLGDRIISGVARRDGTALPDWLDVAFVKALVARVDIGGGYPSYVAAQLDERGRRPQRVACFAREWRAGLLFAALRAKLAGRLSDSALQCVTDYCNGHVDTTAPAVSLLPLAFKRRPDATVHDTVAGMYVLLCSEPAVVVLYRPLVQHDTVMGFASEAAMMAAICQDPVLQQSLLDWMAPSARAIYDNGGFAEPHISRIGVDPFLNFEPPAPASLGVKLWETNVDEQLYQANRDLLVALADLQSTSDAQSRWALLVKGGWLLFNTAALFLRGPVTAVTWLVQAVETLESDLQAISQAGPFDRSAACVDVMLTLGGMLADLRLPRNSAAQAGRLPDVSGFDGPPAAGLARHRVDVMPRQGRVELEGTLARLPGRQLDFSWRGNQGFNWLTPSQRSALLALRADINLKGLAPLASGDAMGTYQVGSRHYVVLSGDPYEVSVSSAGVQVLGPKGMPGPWLTRQWQAWRVDARLRLQAGMPRQATRARLEAAYLSMRQAADALTEQSSETSAMFAGQGQDVLRVQGQIDKLEALMQAEAAKAQADSTVIALYATRQASLRTQLQELRLQAVATVEKAVRLDNEKLTVLERMLEPKYGVAQRAQMAGILREEVATLRSSLIINNDFIFNELWRLAEYPELNALADALRAKALHQATLQYQRYKKALERVVALQERMLVANAQLDDLLTQASPELQLTVGNDMRTVAQLIEHRTFTTQDLRFHHALNLADLALHMDSTSGWRQLADYKADLGGKSLQGAANAHGESITANLAVSDRVSILQEAWDEYSAAIINSELAAVEGGKLVVPAMLARYKAHMQLLKEDAGRRLVEARDVLEGRLDPALSTPAYPRSSETQHVIRDAEGVIAIASEVLEEGRTVLVVRDPLRKAVVQRFDLVDGTWIERVETPGEATPALAATLASVKAALEGNESVRAHAARFVQQDISGKRLTRLFDTQIARLRALQGVLPATDTQAAELLKTGLESLQADKTEHLTELYTHTAYPTAEALRFLHERQLLKVEYVGPRRTMADGSAFDEYKVMRLKAPGEHKGRALWAAHFHLPSGDAMASAFTRGHLKLWAQRFDSNRNMAAGAQAVPGRRVHYGPLTLADAQGIIAF